MSAVATMTVDEQVAQAVALALQGNNKAIADAVAIALKAEKAKRKAKREAKTSSLANDLKTVHKLDQAQASERDMLVEEGHKLCGTGLTIKPMLGPAFTIIGTSRASKASPMEQMKTRIEELEAMLLESQAENEKLATGSNGVTSIHAVAEWLIQSQANDIVDLMGMLPAQRATAITETMLHNLGSTGHQPEDSAMIRQTCNGGVRVVRRPNLPR